MDGRTDGQWMTEGVALRGLLMSLQQPHSLSLPLRKVRAAQVLFPLLSGPAAPIRPRPGGLGAREWDTHTLTPHTLTPHTFSHTHLLQHTHSSKPDGFPSPSLEGSAIPPRCLRQGQELRALVTLKDRQDPHLDSACAGRGSSAWQHGTLWPPLALHSTPSQDRHSQQPLWRQALLTERGLC